MNCCWLLILLFLCGGNGFGGSCGSNSNCGANRAGDEHRCCDDARPLAPPPRGCNDELIPPRGFAGFSGTCGCEDKND